MCCGVKLHDQLIIPFSQLLTNKCVNSCSSETLMDSWEILSIIVNEFLVNPSHVTYYGLLVQEHSLIEVLLFLCMEPVVNSNPPSYGIWVCLPL